MSLLEMKVPSPGESISEVEIATWLVADGVSQRFCRSRQIRLTTKVRESQTCNRVHLETWMLTKRVDRVRLTEKP